MKKIIILSLFSMLISCANKQKQENVQVFSTIENLEACIDKVVALEGKIAHVCSADGRKMKLVLSDGEIITVWPKNRGERFSKADWQGKTIKVEGKLSARAITKNEIDATVEQKQILCHIDLTPCIDTPWINNQWKNENAENIIRAQQQKVHKKMNEKTNDCMQLFSITADELEEIIKE